MQSILGKTGNSEDLQVFETASGDWIDDSGEAIPVAENIIALVIWPREDGDPPVRVLDGYAYDSRDDTRAVAINQLPPVIEIAVVSVDERSAERAGAALQSIVQDASSGLFQSTPSGRFADDLTEFESRLTASGLEVRSAVSAVPVREARWSPDI